MSNAEILITIIKSLMTDGWKLPSHQAFEEIVQAINRTCGREFITLTKDEHSAIHIDYCTEGDEYSHNPPLTSWFVEYFDHNKGHKTLTRLVALASNKQIRAFLSRLDKVQEFKAQCYDASLERQEKAKNRAEFVAKYIADNCDITEKEVEEAEKAFKDMVKVVEEKVTTLNTEFETTVLNEDLKSSWNKRPLYFRCENYLPELGRDELWQHSYDGLVDEVFIQWEADFGFKEPNDILNFAKFMVKVDTELNENVRYAKHLLKEAVKLKHTWDKTSREARSMWADKN